MRQDIESKSGNTAADEQNGYQVERVFIGTRTAEQVVADLIRVHTGSGGQP